MEGPLLIASNHPNSFLDAIIFDILFDVPITSLARGDAFKNKHIFRLLRRLKMLPVYRIREGAQNLNVNYDTFDACLELFQQKEAVLIFSEGFCVNEWHLRPLKKGTARLAFQAWKENIPLKVLPAGINYSSFRRYGKKVRVHLGAPIPVSIFSAAQSDGNNYAHFNEVLNNQLQQLVYEIPRGDEELLRERFGQTSITKKILLGPLAFAGALLNAPVYGLARLVTKMFFEKSDHYDSVMLGFLLLAYPFYLALFTTLAYHFISGWGLLALIALPLTAFCYVKYEVRLDH